MDRLITTVVKGEHIYGLAAVTTDVVEQARQAHGASPTAAAALGRLLTGGLLMGMMLKEARHRIILQISSRGPVRQVVAEADGAGHVRGYLGRAAIQVPSRNGKLDVGGAVGKGILHVIKDLGMAMPSSGTVPLVSGEIAEDLAAYLLQSEQIPSAVSLGVFVQPDYTVSAAGGFLVQFHSTVADEVAAHIEQNLATVPSVTDMIRAGYQPDDMLHQALRGFSLETVRQTTPLWYCHCSSERVIAALVALGTVELRRLIDEQSETEVRCEFCTKAYTFSRHALRELLDSALR